MSGLLAEGDGEVPLYRVRQAVPHPTLFTPRAPTGADTSAEWTRLPSAPASPSNLQLGLNHHQSKLSIRSHWPKKPSVGIWSPRSLKLVQILQKRTEKSLFERKTPVGHT